MQTETSPNEMKRSRNLWPVAIIVYFVVFISFIAGFITFAARQKNDLVEANYYEDEIGFQKQIDRERHTIAMGHQVVIRYDAESHQVLLKLPPNQDYHSAVGRIHFYRPSDASVDEIIPLSVDVHGQQVVDAKKLLHGLWKVRVEWSAGGEDFYFDQPVVVASVQAH